MIYEYNCKRCRNSVDVVKGIRELEFPERCPICGLYMRRLIRGGQLSFGTFRPGYNPAFGETFSTKSQLNEALRRTRDETGRDIVEVGDARPVRKAERRFTGIDKEKVMYDYKKELKRASTR